MEVFLLKFGDFVKLFGLFEEFGFGQPLFPLFGSFGNIVNDSIVITVYFLLEKVCDSAFGMLIPPEITEFV